MRTIVKSERIPIYAAKSPAGDIVKSSISTFRSAVVKYAQERRGLVVVKLADVNAKVKKAAVPYKKREPAPEAPPAPSVEAAPEQAPVEAVKPKRVRKAS